MCIRDRTWTVPYPKGIDEILIKYKELTVTPLIIFTTPEIVTLQIHGTTLTAVSYTHLDVYKRQFTYCPLKSGCGKYNDVRFDALYSCL